MVPSTTVDKSAIMTLGEAHNLFSRYKLLSWATSQQATVTYSPSFAIDTLDKKRVFIKWGIDVASKQIVRREIEILLDITQRNPRYYKFLGNVHVGFPDLVEYHNGKDDVEDFNYMIVQEAGTSLELLHERQEMSFSTSDLRKLASQLIHIIEHVHKTGYVHRDIHPGNVVINGDLKSDAYRVTLIDFGKATSYMIDGKHVPESPQSELNNPSHKAYVNHQTVSRRSDLEMIASLLIELSSNLLPYRIGKVKHANGEFKRKFVRNVRVSRSMLNICERRQLPAVFHDFALYCKKLAFDEEPDYSTLKSHFESSL